MIKRSNNYQMSSNIARLKVYVNNNYKDKDNILLIMFNSFISNYPDKVWMDICEEFFLKIPKEDDLDKIIIYTILSYNLGNSFLKLDNIIISDLIDALLINDVSTYHLTKHASVLLNEDILKLTNLAWEYHLIKPRHIYKLIYDNFDLTNVDTYKYKNILIYIDKFIKEHEINLFNGNYYFFNIYRCLKKLISLKLYNEDLSILELIPLFNTITDDNLKENIKRDFANLEKINKPILEKINDAITITHKYAYDLPIAQKKRDK